MIERFVYNTGTISVAAGGAVVTGTGTSWGGRDREGAQVWVQPADAAPYRVGTVAAVDPRGIYDHTELPLVSPWNGDAIQEALYELVDGAAIANGVTQAAIYARFAAHLEQNMGLVGNTADAVDFNLVPNNSLFVDPVTRVIYQWRNGVLAEVFAVGLAFNPRGAWAVDTDPPYDKNDLVEHDGVVFVSNHDDNDGNEPDAVTPASDAHWTWLPLPSGVGDLFDFGLFVPGRPLAGRVVGRHDFRSTVTFPTGLTASRSTAGAAATAEAVFALKRNGTEFGTVTYDPAGDVATFAAAEETLFTHGDILEVIAPDPRDATLADISFTLAGNR